MITTHNLIKQDQVRVVLLNKEGLACLVSSKKNHSVFSLIGGKVDEGEDYETAAIRETLEETGLVITNLVKILENVMRDRKCITFIADYSGEISYDTVAEPHIVKWASIQELRNHKYEDHVRLVESSLQYRGISYN
jgi:ADP-ribose pyrophosphatase YjhB (NUDIX family)